MAALAAQMLTVAVALLQRQEIHNAAASRNEWLSKYDYIVVGAGSAGSIVASRLSENCDTSVLLLEAGNSANVVSDMPGAYGLNFAGNNWGYFTEPNDKIAQMNPGGRLSMIRGKVIGGTGMINGMVVNRGSKHDFDGWESNYRAFNWNYKRMLPYFKKYETLYNKTNPQLKGSISYHGDKGPLSLSLVPNADPIHKVFLDTLKAAGYKIGDFNGQTNAKVAGIYPQTINPKTWSRASSAHGFLYPFLNRTNLHIIARAHVTKVLLNRGFAYGVEFERNGQRFTVEANNEVILSAGAINTPQILMLSGIGPREELSRHGIPVVRDLPVGQQLQDHPNVVLPFLVKDPNLIQWGRDNAVVLESTQNLYDYYIYNTGPLTQIPVSGAFYSTSKNPNPDWPDTCFFTSIQQITANTIASTSGTTNPAGWRNYFEPLLNDNRYFEMRVSLFRVYSRGTIKLASSNPKDAPLIDPNYYDDPRDEEAQLDGLRRLLEISALPQFTKNAILYDRPVPGCETEYNNCLGKHLKDCCAYQKCYSRYRSNTSFHVTSSAPMGFGQYAVVDNHLRVHGMKRLRVIDASVMPEVPVGNTNAATMAIAEIGSEILIKKYQDDKLLKDIQKS